MNSMLIAIGGNALIRRREAGTAYEQMINARRVAAQIVRLVCRGHKIVLTHGNGPQVGAELLLSERASGVVPERPLDLCDASTQGEMGYLLQQALNTELRESRLHIPVVTVVTQSLVSLEDPAMQRPDKPVGRFYTETEAQDCTRRFGWTMAMDADRGYRRVVPSPRPLEILELEVIRDLFDAGPLVIACGGGGIPVAWQNGVLRGVEAVIDKDLASSLLASQLGVELFVIATDTDCVYLNYGKRTQHPLRRTDTTALERHLRAGQFPQGSMGPKIQSVIEFLRAGGREAVIASCEQLYDAVGGGVGTHVKPAQDRLPELPVRPPARSRLTAFPIRSYKRV